MKVYILASIIVVMGLSIFLLAAYYPIKAREEIKDIEGKEEGEAVISLLRMRMFIIGLMLMVSGFIIIIEAVEVSLILIVLTISVIVMMCFSNYYLYKKYNYKTGIRIKG